MNKYLLSFFIVVCGACSSFFASAQTVTLTIAEPGTSEAIFAQHADAKDVTIKGRINHVDLMLLKSTLRSLERLDLKEVEIEEYTDEDAYIDYKAGEFTNALSYHKTLRHIILPKSLKSIADKALANCKLIETITVPGAEMPKAPKTLLVDKALYAKVQLFVPKDLLQKYKESKLAFWNFTNILPIVEKVPVPFEGLSFDDIYGFNYVALTEKNYPMIYMAYFDNESESTINEIELSYWFDNDTSKMQVTYLNDVQLLPHSSIEEGIGACTFVAPDDTNPHLMYVKPTKVNGVPVSHFGVRVKPFRRYWGDDKRAVRTHLLEIFPAISTPENQAKYKSLIAGISRLETKTKKPGKFEIVTYTDLSSDEKPLKKEAYLLAKYRIADFRIMMNRDLMTPYGTLNNSKELLDLSSYTPALKVGDEITVYQYLFQRVFHNPAFVFLTPSICRVENGKYQAKAVGRISENENLDKDFRLHVYVVENTPLPPMDKETEEVAVPDLKRFFPVVHILSPSEGYKLTVSKERTFEFTTEDFDLSDYQDDHYKLVTFVAREDADRMAYSSILQTASIIFNETNLTLGIENMTSSEWVRPSVYVYNQRAYASVEGWSIEAVYGLSGVQYLPSAELASGVYVALLKDLSGRSYRCKFIVE